MLINNKYLYSFRDYGRRLELCKSIVMLTGTFTILLMLSACGGGGSGDGTNTSTHPTLSSAPVLSNLSYSPDRGYAVPSANHYTETVAGTIDVLDVDGDANILMVAVGEEIVEQINLGGIGDPISSIALNLDVDLRIPGQYPFKVLVLDSQGNESNHLLGQFTVGKQLQITGNYSQDIQANTFHIESLSETDSPCGVLSEGEYVIDWIYYFEDISCAPSIFDATDPLGNTQNWRSLTKAFRLCGGTSPPVDFALDPLWQFLDPITENEYQIEFSSNGSLNVTANIFCMQ